MIGISIWIGVAAGAIAIGEPADIAKQGLAVGIAVNQSGAAAAEAEALRQCRSYKDAPEATQMLCRVAASFSSQCVSTAYDPAAGTPGWGHAVGFTKFTSEDAALQACRTAAGIERARHCAVATTMCDTTN